MEPVSEDAIVLRRREFTESSWLVDFITPGWGCLRTIAKGARRPASPLRGRLELFNRGRLIFYPSRRSDLHLLSQFDVVRFSSAATDSLEKAAHFYYLAELVLAAGFGPEVGRSLFVLLERELASAKRLNAGPSSRIRFEIDYLQALGVFPPLTVCGACGGQTAAGVYFSLLSRSWVCSRCRPADPNSIPIGGGVRALLNRILKQDSAAFTVAMSAEQRKILGRLCRLLVDINVSKKIRSLSFLKQVTGNGRRPARQGNGFSGTDS